MSVCEAGVKLNYIRLILNQTEPYTVYGQEQREAQHKNLAIMQNNVEQDHDQEQNEPQGGHNGNNGRNQASKPFIQPDDPFMLLEEFALLPTVVQTAIRRPPIRGNNFELKSVTL